MQVDKLVGRGLSAMMLSDSRRFYPFCDLAESSYRSSVSSAGGSTSTCLQDPLEGST